MSQSGDRKGYIYVIGLCIKVQCWVPKITYISIQMAKAYQVALSEKKKHMGWMKPIKPESESLVAGSCEVKS